MNDTVRRGDLDAESRAAIYQGMSAYQLGRAFRMHSEDVLRRLGDLQPVGTGRAGAPLFDLAQAAARLVPPVITPEMIDRYMRSVNHSHLPVMTSKHYWEGKRTRETYMEKANELWYTDDVTRVASESFQACRMSLMLLPDALRDDGNLSEWQFRLVQTIVDESIEGLRARLLTELRKIRDQQGFGHPEQEGEVPVC
jgi:hypothetical protein